MALGQSHIEYGLPIWQNAKTHNIEKIQKKIIRNICNSKYNAHTPILFAENNILKIKDLYQISTLRLIKKTLLGKTPTRLRNIIKMKDYDRPQRYNNLQIHAMVGRISNEIPNIWNNLPNELKLEDLTLKQLLNKAKQIGYKNYREQICTKENCYTCNN